MKNKKMIYLFDDVFNIDDQRKIKDTLLNSNSFPWFYQKKSTSIKHSKLIRREEDYFSHMFYSGGSSNSYFYNNFLLPTFAPIFEDVAYFFGKQGYDVIRAKSNFYKKTFNIFEYRTLPLHVDFLQDHITLIYYVMDSDGPTVFETGDRVNPKAGRMVVFDGSIKHSQKVPVFKNRLVLNINLSLK